MEEWVIRLRRAPKVISEVREQWNSAVLVGFKLEVGTTDRELEERGAEFLKKAKCDVVVANDLERIEGDRHRACIIYRNGEMKRWEESKGAIATALVEVLAARLKSH
jgi:phosphopantothenoylcysteine synthetase/decarboxylase